MNDGHPAVGVVFPQLEIDPTSRTIRQYIEAVEALGYEYLTTYEHVVGADPAQHPGWEPRGAGQPFYTHKSAFHEPFALLSYAAAITDRIELATSVLVLPQRQTVLVAKQAAELDLLSDGRFRLGVGAGWNDMEFEALGAPFATRGRRLDEQLALLRRLWTEPVITFSGSWHTLRAVGICPLPQSRPVPLWVGGESPVALRRAARFGDGFSTNVMLDEAPAIHRALVDVLSDARRSPDGFGLEAIVRSVRRPDDVARAVEQWARTGATHVAVDLMYLDLPSTPAHLDTLGQVAKLLGLPQA